MAVAEKPTPETVSRSPQQQLAVGALLGALYVLFAFGLVFSGLPSLWRELFPPSVLNEFLADALLLVVTVPTAVGLVFLGHRLLGSQPRRGLRAGATFGAVVLFVGLIVIFAVGNAMRNAVLDTPIIVVVMALLAGGLLYGLYWLYTRPATGMLFGRLEDNGWFDVSGFKPNQGVRVRRGTVVGILVIVACGLYVLVQHRTLGGGNWEIAVPFLQDKVLPIMYRLNINALLLIAAAGVWLAVRIVNWPVFADFLIATEAEMNKVSWTTRKKLVQDTVVVLITVFLLTVFLFVVDILWVLVLSNPAVRVLVHNPLEERAKQNNQASW